MLLREEGLPFEGKRASFLCQSPTHRLAVLLGNSPPRGWLHRQQRITPHKPNAYIFSGHQ